MWARQKKSYRRRCGYDNLSLAATYAGRFVVENEMGNGLFKMLVDRKMVTS